MEFLDIDHQESILLFFSNKTLITGTTCRRSRMRIDFYGQFDKPLGRYLQDDLFDQKNCCQSCWEPTEAHIISYTHHLGNLTINVRRVPSLNLEGKDDGKIWTWHQCLICGQIDGVPPATRRAVMSDADFELSLGKFLLLSFSKYAAANNLASCGHSLERDCIQYYGFGNMVISLQYSTVEIFSVCFPSSTLDLNVSATSLLSDGARSMVPQNSKDDIVIAVYDNEPTSMISYALASKEYEDRIGNASDIAIETSESCNVSIDFDVDESCISVDQKTPPRQRIFSGVESPNDMGKVKFSVACHFANWFCVLRKRCCIGELDFIRSLSRCSAQGGKSDTYFAKSLDERFIIKQVTRTEFESFDQIARRYFKHLTTYLGKGGPTCLRKILGIYQVTTKHLHEDVKETKMDLVVMENIFFKRKISRAYTIKDSARSHRISNIADTNEVSLDMNISETIPTIPIYLGIRAQNTLSKAVWNDIAFLSRVKVIDYSLLVGVDEECRELVVGIIDFMTRNTPGKDENWISASCIHGGTENATIISSRQYMKRFREILSTSFLTVRDA